MRHRYLFSKSCRSWPLLLGLGLAVVASAQPPGMPPAVVRYTAALDDRIRQTIELAGSVEARRSSVVASEIAGLVVAVSAREGERVGRGAPLVKLRRETAALRLAAVRGELKEAEARLELARASRDRAQGLFEEEVISVQQLDDALSEFAARHGRVEQLEAEVARLEDELERTVVRAPYSGVVVRERVAEGEWIPAGGAVAELVDTGSLELALDVPERYFATLATGEAVTVVIDALPGETFAGQLRAVVPSADPQARTFPAKVELPETAGRLGVGMLGRARFAGGEPRPAVLVPKDAIVAQGAARAVFVVEDDRVRRAPVETVGARGDWVAVEGEIAAGEFVVTRGNERLQPGQAVSGEELAYPAPGADS